MYVYIYIYIYIYIYMYIYILYVYINYINCINNRLRPAVAPGKLGRSYCLQK